MATDINILIKATDQASPAIKKVEGELKQVGATAKSSSSMMSGFGNVMKAGLTTALVGTAAAVGGLVFAFKDSIGAAKESIQANKQLEQVIKSTGGAAGVTADQARELATSLSQVTNFGDDAIVAGENLLLTFTGIGKDVFPRATEAMLDMSQALGQDMSSSAVQLGKALNDPINGMTALSRVGVSFTDQQKEMITTMQEAGDVAGAQAVILDELAKEFGGSAKALADPATQLANAWGEVQEAVGMALIPVLNNLAQTVLPYVQAAAEAVGTAVQNFYKYLGDGKPVLEAIQQAISDVLPDDYKEKWNTFADYIQGKLNTITGTIQTTMGLIRLAWDTDWGGMQTTLANFQTEATRSNTAFWIEFHKTFDFEMQGIKFDWATFWGDTLKELTDSWVQLVDSLTSFLRLFRSAWGVVTSFLKGDWASFWVDIASLMDAALDLILAGVEDYFSIDLRAAFVKAMNNAWEGMKEVWQNIAPWWVNTIGALIGMAIPTPNFAIVNPANVSTPVGGGGPGVGGGTVNNIVVNQSGGSYDQGVATGEGILDAMHFGGH